jgi:aminomethyltransferase
MSAPDQTLLTVPLHDLHVALGARMVPFAGYHMPVQYPAGLMAEHKHTRESASLFDVSHMGQLRLLGTNAAGALESLMPMDAIDLPAGKQRYGLLLNEQGGILDDLMMFRKAVGEWFVVVNGACKVADIAHMKAEIGHRCAVHPMPEHALLALQGPKAAMALERVVPGVSRLVFMSGGDFTAQTASGPVAVFLTRSGYTGEDGFEISVHQDHALALAQALLAQPEVLPAGLGARNSLRLEAGLPLYGNDLDTTTTAVEAGLTWAIQKVRRPGGSRDGTSYKSPFPGASIIAAQLQENSGALTRKRVGLKALERVPVREHVALQSEAGEPLGEVTSGLLSPTLGEPIAMAYVPPAFAAIGTRVVAVVRGKPVPMEVVPMPFVPTRYYRG